MTAEQAILFLHSLLDRIETDPESGTLRVGALSRYEKEAIEIALARLEGSEDAGETTPAPPPPTPPAERPIAAAVPGPLATSGPELDLSALEFEAPPETDLTLCLDFGTAMSKAFATVTTADDFEHLPLRLGQQAKETTLEFPAHSSVWFGDDGRIYLGHDAVRLSLETASVGRSRFDSLKQRLIKGFAAGSPDQTALPAAINPTDTFVSYGDAITLYLAYLTDLATTQLESTHGRSRYARRRFALPSFEPQRRAWGEEILAEALARAQIVADTFRGQWANGIPVEAAKSVLDRVRSLDRLPRYLVGQGVTEPLAAGSSRFRQEEPHRGLVMVVDVGAGTTDFALFLVAEQPEREIFRAWSIKGCNEALHTAGDTLDKVLQRMILKKERLEHGDPDYRDASADLGLRIRTLKEDLFRDGFCDYLLTVNSSRGSVELEDFLGQPQVVEFQAKLRQRFAEVVAKAHSSFPARCHGGGLTVIRSGGGARLPMIEELCTGSSSAHGHQLTHHAAPLVPDDLDEDLREEFPQLAVAIGGSSSSLVEEGSALDKMPGLADSQWVVGRFQSQGL